MSITSTRIRKYVELLPDVPISIFCADHAIEDIARPNDERGLQRNPFRKRVSTFR